MMADLFHIEVMSHGVRLKQLTPKTLLYLKPFVQSLELKEDVQVFDQKTRRMLNTVEIKKRFFISTHDKTELFIHRHCFDDLMAYLTSEGITDYKITHKGGFVGDAISPAIQDKFIAKPYQEVIIKAATGPSHTTGIKLYTGGGKTFCSLAAAAQLKTRTEVCVAPKFFGIWIEALADTYKEGTYSVECVSGSKALRDLIDRATRNESLADFIIISNVTYRAYIESYERFGEFGMREIGYSVPPMAFHEVARIGLQINDEIQDDPGLVFKTDCITNIPKQLYLSATPYTGNDHLTRMINKMLPPELDAPIPPPDVYAEAVCVLYNDHKVTKKDYTGYKNAYSHIAYEKSLLKDKTRRDRYFKMIADVIERSFVNTREPGQKALVFCAMVEFIDKFLVYLKQRFPEIQIGKYVAETAYEELLNNDITVTTIKSAGTGVDIRNVRELILTHATNSKRDNIQILGRARRLKDFPDATPRFLYFACMQIPQQLKYMTMKSDYFAGRVKRHKKIRY